MRKVRDVLRLKHTLGMSFRQINEATGVSKTVVGEYVRPARVIGITWPVPEAIEASLQLSEAALVGLGLPTGPVIASIHEKRDEIRRQRFVSLPV